MKNLKKTKSVGMCRESYLPLDNIMLNYINTEGIIKYEYDPFIMSLIMETMNICFVGGNWSTIGALYKLIRRSLKKTNSVGDDETTVYNNLLMMGFITHFNLHKGVDVYLTDKVIGDLISASTHYEEALKIKSDDPILLYLLSCARIDMGCRDDYMETIKIMQKSAKYGSVASWYNLGVLYYEGSDSIVPRGEQSYELSVSYFTKASDLGNYKAMFILGWLYYRGLGVSVDYSKAFDLWRQVAINYRDDFAIREILNIWYTFLK